jgi:hypothetical protein
MYDWQGESKKHSGNRVRIPKNGFMGRAQTWRLVSSCDIKVRYVPVYAESSNRKDAALLNWTVILESPLRFETTLPEREEKKNILWNDQNEQETEDLVELPSRLLQRQVYEGSFVGLRRLLEGLFCKNSL